jgi:hypothetical protein
LSEETTMHICDVLPGLVYFAEPSRVSELRAIAQGPGLEAASGAREILAWLGVDSDQLR